MKLYIQGVAMKFPEIPYCKHSCVVIIYWQGSPSNEQLCT